MSGITTLGALIAIPHIPENLGLIDTDTPSNVFTKPSWNGGPDLQLVFSDEFNTPGTTFWPGDDPYWEAQTNNLEWYDPEAITTRDAHNLNYQGGENKFCFTGGYIEASVSLPGVNNVVRLWSAIWTLGDLGRAGYGASLEAMWPYTYNACVVGTAPNQTFNGLPLAATQGRVLSFLPGQRLSRCTCKGKSHPGPLHSDGTFVGRAAPDVDMFEAQITGVPLTGQVSQSAQWAPFNAGCIWLNTSSNEIIPNPSATVLNTYQQATSGVTTTNQDRYEGETGCFLVYDFEYVPGFENAYITWIANNEVAWTLNVAGMGPDPTVNVSARPIPQEPMYIIMNLAYTNPNLTTWKNDCNQPFLQELILRPHIIRTRNKTIHTPANFDGSLQVRGIPMPGKNERLLRTRPLSTRISQQISSTSVLFVVSELPMLRMWVPNAYVWVAMYPVKSASV
ncbi:beta-glucan synthesis-associated protein-domain-containing protein [Suillus discolor]|uniref:Beta-glucan synthesis-associated protein-domain-containing protein n=1 Tax=Suillus discolor TaxID=1912936 RepID=A0A9P7JST7_9AGAM|nr:beta-glucan synthesis-associated protein-domain-containing protein [Suillus discolor]KAG2105113.1 beta-glucan synthesis-associated protein-domain-containing protein [Suillus discolor]